MALTIEKEEKSLEKIFRTRNYKKYENEEEALSKTVLAHNRRLLFDGIRGANLPQDKLIIVTHERMYRIAEEGVTPLIHIFGHVHKYKFSRFKGTYYLNTAALDNGYSSVFAIKEFFPEGYCQVVFSRERVSVKRIPLFEDTAQAIVD